MKTIVAIALVSLIAGGSPGMEGPRVEFTCPAGALTLPGEHVLFEIYDDLEGRKPGPGALTSADFKQVELEKTGSVQRLVFTQPPEAWRGDLRVTVALEPAEKEVLGSIRVESEGGRKVRLVRFPVIDTPHVESWHTLLFSHLNGDSIRDPRIMIGNRLGGYYSRRYPADVSMQWMDFYTEARNWYLAAYHQGDEFYNHTVRSAPDHRLRMSFDWYPFLDQAGDWGSPQCAVSILPGDWHSAADLYREHMGEVFKPPKLPAWMREDFHGWLQFSLKGGEEEAAYRYSELPQLYRDTVADVGLNTMHCFSWQHGGFHYFPDFEPAPVCGTAGELRDAMDEIRAMGGHVDLYTHGSAMDTNSDFFRRDRGFSAVRTADGGVLLAGTGNPTPMLRVCPSSRAYQDEFIDVYRRMIEEYHAHGAQIDTNACIPAEFCYNDSHGHVTPANGWLPGEDALLRRLHEYYRAADPDFFVWVEGTNERFGQFYEVNQGHGEGERWSAGEGTPEQFYYVYPDHLCTGFSDGVNGLCHTFGQGKPFDIHGSRRLKDPEYGPLLRDLIQVRKSEPDYFLRGRFRDTVGLTVAAADVCYWRIDHRGGKGMCVNFWARSRQRGDRCEAAIQLPGGMKRIRGVYPGNLRISEDGSWRHLAWSGPVATVVFEK